MTGFIRTSLCLALLTSLAAPAATPVALYPVQGKADAAAKASAADTIHAGVKASSARGAFEPASPFVLPPNCKTTSSACLVKLAGGGHVLYADAKSNDAGRVAVTVWLIYPDGARSRPVRFEFDPLMQDARAGYAAIELLEGGQNAAAAAPEPTAAAPATDVIAPSKAAPPPPVNWLDAGSKVVTFGGLGAVGAGAAFGLLSRGVSDDLDRRYQAGELLPTDAGKYDQVRAYNLLANTLMVGGAVATAVGLTMWGMVPSVGAGNNSLRFSVSGRF